MAELTREQKFKMAQEARAKAKAEQGGFGGGYTAIDYQCVALEQNKCQVLRLLGESIETRVNKTDALLVERSMVKGDDDKWFTLIWDKDTNWPMRVLMRTLAKYKWDKTANGGRGARIYENDGCELLKRFLTNGQQSKFESGMLPKKAVLINAIDRMDDWCVTNKHSKLLAWTKTIQDDKTYYNKGINYGLYSDIFDTKCTEVGLHFNDFDIVVRRYSEDTRPNEKTNSDLYWYENKTPINRWGEKDKVDYYSHIVVGDLTEEEKKYELYELEDIPFLSKPTPAGVILSKLGKFVKEVDKKYDTKVYELLVEQKAKEKAEWEATKKDEEAHTFATSNNKVEQKEEDENQEDEELPNNGSVEENTTVEEPKVKAVKKVASTSITKDSITKEMIELWPGLKTILELPEEEMKHELSLIKKLDTENQEIIWNTTDMATCGNEDCGMDIANDSKVCVFCSQKY